MGTSKTLDTDDLALAGEVVSAALDAGTTLFDSSPMYGKAERMLGTALEAAMVTGRLDAIQIPYNPREREVEDRLLPLAAELGLGVLIMRPFAAADLMRSAPSATDLAPLEPFGIHTWGQALLQWGLSHPATTVSIPATSKPSRAQENASAGDAEPLDEEHRQLIGRLAGA